MPVYLAKNPLLSLILADKHVMLSQRQRGQWYRRGQSVGKKWKSFLNYLEEYLRHLRANRSDVKH